MALFSQLGVEYFHQVLIRVLLQVLSLETGFNIKFLPLDLFEQKFYSTKLPSLRLSSKLSLRPEYFISLYAQTRSQSNVE